MKRTTTVQEPALERQGIRMIRPALRFFEVALIPLIAGIVLVLVGHDGLLGLGIALILLGSAPLAIAFGLLIAAAVARWAARRKLFA